MRYTFILILMSCSFYMHAQEEDSIQINTDRPGFSDFPKTIPRGYFQLEAGFSYESETVNPNDRIQKINWNNLLLKYGLTPGWELRLGQSYQSERVLEDGGGDVIIWQTFSGPVVVGTKIDLLKEAGVVPQTAVLVEYGFNTFDIDTQLDNSYFRLQLTSKYNLNSEWYLMANLGVDNIKDFMRLRYTVNTGYSLNEKLTVYAEIYGFRSETLTPLNYFDGGITYLINPKFQLDIHAGFDLVEQTNNMVEYQQSFIAIGLGHLLKIHE
ncbi:MAG: transporter [Bacteroidota bacterium]